MAAGAWTWTSESYPADAVSLRSVSSDNFVVVDTTHDTRVIGETDFIPGKVLGMVDNFVTVETGQFAVIRRSIGGLSGDARVQAVLIGFAFGAFPVSISIWNARAAIVPVAPPESSVAASPAMVAASAR